MAFNGHQTTLAYSLFPASQHQAKVSGGGGGNHGALPFSAPSVSLQEQDTTSYLSWSNAQDDPNGFISCSQSSTENRNPNNNNGTCDGEADLQGLVSNIVDEADSQDSYLNNRNLPTCNPLWSLKTLREELLQSFQSDVKTQYNQNFPVNHLYSKDISNGQGESTDQRVENVDQKPSGIFSSRQWPYNLPNGDGYSYTLRPQKLPPGLPVPNTGNTFLSQTVQNHDSMSANQDGRSSRPMKNSPDPIYVFQPQGAMSSSYFNPYYESHYNQSSAEPISTEQQESQDIDKLVKAFQSYRANGHHNFCDGDFSDPHKKTDLYHQDIMAEQWKATNPASPSQMNPAVHTPTQLTGKLGLVQIKKNGGLRNQEHTRDGFPVVPEYFQQPKSFPESNGFPNQYQNKMKMHRGTHSLPASMVTNQYSKNHIQQGQIQSKFLPQIQKEKRTNMPGFVEEFPTRHKTQAPLQRFDHFWSMQSQKILSENGMKKVVNTQHSAGDPRKHSNVTNGHTNFNCRSTPPNGGFVPSMDRGGMSANEFSALKSSTWLNGGRPGVQFYSYLNECNDQWTCLEKERQRVEAILNKEFPNQRPMAEIDPGLPRVPPNATVVDHLIANQMRERGKVENLLHRMEILSKVPLHINIHMVLNKQRIAITSLLINWVTQKDNMLKHQQRRARFKDDRETLLVVVALKDLSVTTRRLRTALWSALHMTLPRPVRRQDQHVNREEAVTESPIWGFSFIV